MTLINILILIGFVYFLKYYLTIHPTASAAYKGTRYILRISRHTAAGYYLFSLSASPEKKGSAISASAVAAPAAEITITGGGAPVNTIRTDPALSKRSQDKRTYSSYVIWKLNNERGEVVLPGTYTAQAVLEGDAGLPKLNLSFAVGQ